MCNGQLFEVMCIRSSQAYEVLAVRQVFVLSVWFSCCAENGLEFYWFLLTQRNACESIALTMSLYESSAFAPNSSLPEVEKHSNYLVSFNLGE